MKRLYLFILKSYLGPLVMTFFIALFILLMQFLWKYIDDMVGKGLEWYIIAKLLFYASSTFVPLALPLAILLSSLMMFGNLGEHYELVAMKAAGISLSRIMKPLIIVSICISSLAFYFANVVLPTANLKFLSLLFDIREKKLSFNIKEGIFYSGIEGFVIRVGKKDSDGSTIRDVMVYDHTHHQGNVSLTVAEWGKMELSPDKRYLVFRLFNGSNYEERVDLRNAERTHPYQRTRFKEQFQQFDLTAFQLTRTDEKLFKSNYEMLNVKQLNASIDSIQKEVKKEKATYDKAFFQNYTYLAKYDSVSKKPPKDTVYAVLPAGFISGMEVTDQKRILEAAKNAATSVKENLKVNKENIYQKNKLLHKHEVVLQKKFTFSIACFLLFFIGAPLGAIIRKGGLGLPAVISTIFFILFWVLSFTGEKYSVEGVLPAYQGMWIAPAVLLPIGIFLTYKATIDASLLDIEAWVKLFNKIFRISERPQA
ncbi:MAG TPA: LptF/LptG family permease [Bacteroidales bacterium]|nr:LptF/LptG family permease [Bacteroidales bacterium]